MIYAKIQPQGILGYGEDILKVFTIYGHGGHLGQCMAIILAVLHYPAPRRPNLNNIGPETPEEKFEILNIFPIQMHREANLTLP